MANQYVVRSTPGVVELWSTVRLPFEPRGWLLEMRNDLRQALQALTVTSNGRLHASYGANDDRAFVDTENVLLYNVGGTALGALMKRSLTFERSYQVPVPPSGSGLADGTTLHYQRYGAAADSSFDHWMAGASLGSCTDVPVESMAKPATVWKAIRDHALPPAETFATPRRFVINVHITDGRRARSNGSASGLVKPVLDGIISAFHGHEGSDGIVEAQRLAESGIGSAEVSRAQLLDPRWAALGARRLVKPFGATGVQWNPADEFCVAANVVFSTGAAGAPWRLTAELRDAVPR